MNYSPKNESKSYFYASCAILTSLTCILAPFSIPIGPIPISLTNLVIYFSIYIIGYKGATVSYIIYLLIGLIGLPVFSGFQGGPAKLVGPTGGYLIGFIFITLIGGIFFKIGSGKLKIPMAIIGMIVGTAITYLFGTVWFVRQAECDFAYALSVCVIPFIPFDLIKIAIATAVGIPVRNGLKKSNLLYE